jgi:transposase
MAKHYSPEFRDNAVDLVLKEGLKVKQAAQDLSIGKSTLDKWIQRRKASDQQTGVLNEQDYAELKRLRRENRTLKMERDILKKATVFFAKSNPES